MLERMTGAMGSGAVAQPGVSAVPPHKNKSYQCGSGLLLSSWVLVLAGSLSCAPWAIKTLGVHFFLHTGFINEGHEWPLFTPGLLIDMHTGEILHGVGLWVSPSSGVVVLCPGVGIRLHAHAEIAREACR
jgi:hypothetical protein